jgi:hypothetical protein
METPELMSTRLHKKKVYTIDDLTGLSKKCDIFIFKTQIIFLKYIPDPRYFFISTHSSVGLFYFIEKILPTLKHPIVLILASEDITFPRGEKDVRCCDYFGYRTRQPLINSMINHPIIKRIFVENLDTLHPKLTPIPLGIHPVYDSEFMKLYNELQLKLTFDTPRTDRILCVHRLWEDGTSQWDDRKKVNKHCSTIWAPYVQFFTKLDDVNFRAKLLESKFVMCVHGGGIDPSPKVWQALLCGCMPIIESSTLDEAYSRFPVIYVDNWDSNAITSEKISEWIILYEKFYNNVEARKNLLKMLTLDYWWDIITNT